MDKEKLLLIKEILIYADEEKIKLLPADVVSKLLKESIDILQVLKNDESEHKPLYLEFVVKTDIKDKELKKQLLEEIMEIGKTIPSYDEDKTKFFNQYVTSIMKFNTLGPSKEQLLSWAKKTKNSGEDNPSRMNKIIDEFQAHEFSNQEILSVCQSYLSSDIGITYVSITLLNIYLVLSNEDTYQWLKEKEISLKAKCYEKVLRFLMPAFVMAILFRRCASIQMLKFPFCLEIAAALAAAAALCRNGN